MTTIVTRSPREYAIGLGVEAMKCHRAGVHTARVVRMADVAMAQAVDAGCDGGAISTAIDLRFAAYLLNCQDERVRRGPRPPGEPVRRTPRTGRGGSVKALTVVTAASTATIVTAASSAAAAGAPTPVAVGLAVGLLGVATTAGAIRLGRPAAGR